MAHKQQYQPPRGKALNITANPLGSYPKPLPLGYYQDAWLDGTFEDKYPCPQGFWPSFRWGWKKWWNDHHWVKTTLKVMAIIYIIEIVANRVFRSKYHYNTVTKIIKV